MEMQTKEVHLKRDMKQFKTIFGLQNVQREMQGTIMSL